MLYRMILNLLVYINKWFGILITKVVYFERAKYSAKKYIYIITTLQKNKRKTLNFEVIKRQVVFNLF